MRSGVAAALMVFICSSCRACLDCNLLAFSCASSLSGILCKISRGTRIESVYALCEDASYLTGDLNGVAASDPEIERALLPRGACAARGILEVTVTVTVQIERRVLYETWLLLEFVGNRK